MSAPKEIYAQLRAGTFDALPRVVWIKRALFPRRMRRRWCKAALLAKRDVSTEPYFQTEFRNEARPRV